MEFIKNRQFYNLKFKRQQPIGDYIIDFICKEAKIIVEIVGVLSILKQEIIPYQEHWCPVNSASVLSSPDGEGNVIKTVSSCPVKKKN